MTIREDTICKEITIGLNQQWSILANQEGIPEDVLRAANPEVSGHNPGDFIERDGSGRLLGREGNPNNFPYQVTLNLPCSPSDSVLITDNFDNIFDVPKAQLPYWEEISQSTYAENIVGFNEIEGAYVIRRSDGTLQSFTPFELSTTFEEALKRSEVEIFVELDYTEVVPHLYTLNSSDDFLRMLWETQWGRTDEFDSSKAHQLFLNEFTSHHLHQGYIESYAYLQALESGGVLPFDPMDSYMPDLAVRNWWWSALGGDTATGTTGESGQAYFEDQLNHLLRGYEDYLGLDFLAELLYEMGLDQEETDFPDRETIYNALLSSLPENYSHEDIAMLVNNVALQIRQKENAFDYSVDTELATQISQATADYLIAAEIDRIRNLVYNSGWDQEKEAEELIQLSQAINNMHDAILGVSISEYKQGFIAYRELMEQRHGWLVRMKNWLDEYERILLEQEQGIGELDEFLWWMVEAGLGMLYEPLDWVISIRDLIVDRDLFALVGLLPIIPSSIRHLRAITRNIPALTYDAQRWLRGMEQLDEIDNIRFQANADLLFPILGPAHISHPEELQEMLRQLEKASIQIRYQSDTYAYDMVDRLIIDPDASIGAWKHEFRHFLDDMELGHPGMRYYFENFDEFWRLEFQAYMEEINIARQIREFGVARSILEQMRDRRRQILGY